MKQVHKNRHYVFANSLNWSGLHAVFDHKFNQTLCVSYFTECISGSFGNGQVNKSRHNGFDIILGLLGDSSITDKQIKADTMC